MKEALIQYCQFFISQKLEINQKLIDTAKESLESEGKSSAGDKHETGRAMAQLEMEKAGAKHQELLQLHGMVSKLGKGQGRADQIGFDSLIQTDKETYYLAISIGPVKIENSTVIIISPKSPLGAGFIGKKIGDYNSFNGVKIQSIS